LARSIAQSDEKLDKQAKDMTAELDKLKAMINPTGATKSPKTPTHPWRRQTATTFDSEIMIDGIIEEPGESLLEVCITRVFDVLGVVFTENQVECIYRVGRELNANDEEVVGPRRRPRSILVKFHYPSCKDICIKHSYKLRGQRIFINQHYSPNIERKRKRLYPILKKAKQLEYNDRISIEDDKIILDGKRIGIEDF
jgi:hypothetical protein